MYKYPQLSSVMTWILLICYQGVCLVYKYVYVWGGQQAYKSNCNTHSTSEDVVQYLMDTTCQMLINEMGYHFVSDCFIYLSFFFVLSLQHGISFSNCLSCSWVQSLCDFFFLMWLLLQMLHPFIRPFIFRVLGCLNLYWNLFRFYMQGSYCLTWIQAVALTLHEMAFWLSGEVVALLDSITVKAYLCNQDCTASPFLSRLTCNIFNLADMYGITLIPSYIPTHLNVEADYLAQGRYVPEWHLLPNATEASFQHWGQLGVDLLASSHTNQCQHYYTLETPLNFRWVMCFLLY